MSLSRIMRSFDSAAPDYDRAAQAQALIARRLVDWAASAGIMPQNTLDIGSGTGFVAAAIDRRWPQAQVTALDASPAMLAEARRKMPRLSLVQGDILSADFETEFDAIFSSMALHWLPEPRAALERWRSWLKPEGKLFVALPVAGSFHEWRDLCRQHGASDGLWPLPPSGFADDLAANLQHEDMAVTYPSARDFLNAMKTTGAATPRKGHKPVGAGKMRAIIASTAPSHKFEVTFRLVFLAL